MVDCAPPRSPYAMRATATNVYALVVDRRPSVALGPNDTVRVDTDTQAERKTTMKHMHNQLFQLAIVKGIKEHNDGTAYFGSLGGYLKYRGDAEKWGWITGDDKPALTELGERVYVECKLSSLPNKMFSRAYGWDWDDIEEADDLIGGNDE